MNSSGHLLKQTFTLSDGAPPSHSPHNGTDASANLALPNPFKALKGLKSSENLDFEGKEDGHHDRIQLNDSLDLGPIPFSNPVAGIRLVIHGARLRGVLWSDSELSVSTLFVGQLYPSLIRVVIRYAIFVSSLSVSTANHRPERCLLDS